MRGSCLCGNVRYEACGEALGINYCHCRQCRKASGTAFATNAGVARSRFEILEGEDSLAAYATSPGKARRFCRRCGSPIFSESERSPEVVYVRIGTLDDDEGLAPDVHIHVGSKAAWYEIRDELPQLREEEGLWF